MLWGFWSPGHAFRRVSFLRSGEGPAAPACSKTRSPQRRNLTVAVLGFADRGPSVELAPLRIALAEMLTGDLSQLEGIRAVERVRVAQFLGETNLSESA